MRSRSFWKSLRTGLCSQHSQRSGLKRRIRRRLRWVSYTPRASARNALKLSVRVRAPLHNRVGVDGMVGVVAVCDRARVARLNLGPWRCDVLQQTAQCVVTQTISIVAAGHKPRWSRCVREGNPSLTSQCLGFPKITCSSTTTGGASVPVQEKKACQVMR